MNKLLFHEGGQPLHLDDLKFMQDATETMIKGIVSAFGDGVVSGCEIEDIKEEIYYKYKPGYMLRANKPGFVIIKGELFYVPEGDVSSVEAEGKAFWVWKINEEDTQVMDFENGSQHPIYRIRTACMAKVNVIDDTCIHMSESTLKDKLEVVKNTYYVLHRADEVQDVAAVIFTALANAGYLVTVKVPFSLNIGTTGVVKLKEKEVFNIRKGQKLPAVLRGGAVTVMNFDERQVTFKMSASGDGTVQITHDGGSELSLSYEMPLSFTFMIN